MRALQYSANGDPADVVAVADVEPPQPKAGQVRLRMSRATIHNHDLATIRGTYGYKPSLPAIGGTEMAGVVDAHGEGVTAPAIGQRVAAMAPAAWAEYAVTDAATVFPLSDNISDDFGAQLIAMPLSTVVLFDSLKLDRGAWIVQNAAGGAVGKIMMRCAERAGVNLVNLVRREEAVAELRALGAKHVFSTSDEAWPQRVREAAGDAPIARVVDSVCDANSTALNRLLGPDGEHVVFGALGGRGLLLDPGAMIFGETRVRGFWMSRWMTQASQADRAAAVGRVYALASGGDLPLAVASVHPLRDAKTALLAAETPGRPGKVLFAP